MRLRMRGRYFDAGAFNARYPSNARITCACCTRRAVRNKIYIAPAFSAFRSFPPLFFAFSLSLSLSLFDGNYFPVTLVRETPDRRSQK